MARLKRDGSAGRSSWGSTELSSSGTPSARPSTDPDCFFHTNM
jgi:hypothetical protein